MLVERDITGQISLFDWKPVQNKPVRSGVFRVRDIMGREFDTWYEQNRGFNHVPKGDTGGYNIAAWRITNASVHDI